MCAAFVNVEVCGYFIDSFVSPKFYLTAEGKRLQILLYLVESETKNIENMYALNFVILIHSRCAHACICLWCFTNIARAPLPLHSLTNRLFLRSYISSPHQMRSNTHLFHKLVTAAVYSRICVEYIHTQASLRSSTTSPNTFVI